jgi:FeS assembly protein IscX
MTHSLTWEDSFEIVLTLEAHYGEVDLDSVGLHQLQTWILALPDFIDDPLLVNDGILNDILREWYEERFNLWR